MFPKTEKKTWFIGSFRTKGETQGEIAEKGKDMAKLGCRRKEMLEDIIQLQYTLLQ